MDSLQRKKRSGNITNEQRSLLIEYMKKHPQLIKGKFSSSFTWKDSVQLWNDIAQILNAVGTKKDWKGWRKCWHDFQSRSKKKHSTIKQSMGKTGGGTMNIESLTTQEEDVLDIMCSTSIDGHPEIEESTVNLLQIPEEEIMAIEYLDEDEENISQFHDTDTNSNECNIVSSQKSERNIDKEFTSQKIVSEKENSKTSKTYKIIKDNQRCIANKSIEESEILLNNANSSKQNRQNNNVEQTPFNVKEKNTRSKQLKNTIEVSAHLNNIYEKTYELKKSYYESKIEYLNRFVEATEKVANILEQYFSY